MSSIPDGARAIAARYETLADEILPGRLEGLYLVGSVALHDYVPGASDVDFIAVTAGALEADALALLEQVHARLTAQFPRPAFSGIYVTWPDLERNPLTIDRVPFYLDGWFRPSGGFDANPPVWLTLRTYPLALRGPSTPEVWHDADVVRAWCRENLHSYWQRYARRHRAVYGRGMLLLADWAITWCVPGVARLHYTITTGDVTSKAGACRYGLKHLPEQWHPVLRDVLALRTGEGTSRRNRVARRREALDFMQWVIDDAG